MKKYNFYCIKECSECSSCLDVSEQINETPLSRRQIFESIFQFCLPKIFEFFTSTSYSVSVSISRSFFSSFNKTTVFRLYAFCLDYLKKAYKFLSDKIVLARVCVEVNDVKYIYIFFAKEVCDE